MSCPRCESKRTRWRSGVGFENEIICFNCWATWEPGTRDEYDLRAEGDEIKAKKKADAKRQQDLEDAELSGMGMDAPI